MDNAFIASIVMFGGNFAPRNWAYCDGQLLAINSNTALFSLLGTTYGGDGRTTMGLPDLRGRVPMHPGNGPGLSQRRLGERSGVESVTLNTTQIPSHNHSVTVTSKVNVASGAGSLDAPGGNFLAPIANGYSNAGSSGRGEANLNGVSSDVNQNNIGSNQAHTNIQPYTCVNFIIALVGLYPSRS